MICRTRRARPRRGAAAIEMAMIAPFLTLAALGALDYGLCLRAAAAVTECARSGASAATDPAVGATTLSSAATTAAQAAAVDLNVAPTIAVTSGTDSEGLNYVEVKATYTFNGVIGGPTGLSSVTIVRKARMVRNPNSGS